MEKQILLKNILKELNQLPETYLLHWYNLIHSFRENLPVTEQKKPEKEEEFDWDIFVNELMDNRKKQNQNRMSRVEALLKD